MVFVVTAMHHLHELLTCHDLSPLVQSTATRVRTNRLTRQKGGCNGLFGGAQQTDNKSFDWLAASESKRRWVLHPWAMVLQCSLFYNGGLHG